MRGKVLIICEKNSVAKMIADTYRATKKNGYYEIQPCKSFPDGAYIAYAAGHLLAIQTPGELDEKWKEWRLDTLPILPNHLNKKVDPSKSKLLSTIRTLANKSDVIVNAGDADVEGTYLIHEIILFLGIKKPLKRLWLTSLTPGSIKKAVNRMEDYSKRSYMYWQGLARSEADWLYGMNFSRQFTLLLHEHERLKNKSYPLANKKQSNVFSVGRVQTVVNYLIYKRELAIENFISEPFWDVYATFNMEGKSFTGKWFIPDAEHIFHREQAEFLMNEIKGKSASVIDMKEKERSIRPPQFYNLTSLQKAVDKLIGLSPDQTLTELQNLYLEGYISYPRTNIVYVGKGEAETFPTILDNLSSMDKYKELLPAPIKDISEDKRFVNPSKVQEHYGIILTEKKVDISRLNHNQQVIYDLIAKSMIAAHYPDVKLKEVDVVTLVDDKYTFKTKGREILDKGWYQVIPAIIDDLSFPNLTTFEGVVTDSNIKDGKTQPLSRWSEADVVVMMANAYKELPKHVRSDYSTDELALGTVATRAEIVKGLKDRGYIKVKDNKVYITEKGRILSVAMEDIDLFTSPITTGNMQKHLNEEIRDYESYLRFITGIRKRVHKTFNDVMERHTHWDFSAIDLSALPEKRQHSSISHEPIGICPICSKNVLDKGHLYACESEPECNFKLWKKQFGRNIELEHAQSLLEKHTTPLLEFFSEKTQRSYPAFLVWDDNEQKVKLSFPR